MVTLREKLLLVTCLEGWIKFSLVEAVVQELFVENSLDDLVMIFEHIYIYIYIFDYSNNDVISKLEVN